MMLLTFRNDVSVDEQNIIFGKIITIVPNQKGMFFSCMVMEEPKKLLCGVTVASSGIATILFQGGRTAHSKLKIPVPTLDNSMCNIEPKDDHAEMLRQTQLIIWDEAHMAHKHCFEAVDRSLRDIMSNHPNSNSIFGSKVIVFGGNFR